MRILQTATAYYPSVGGAQLHWYAIARILKQRGHDVGAIAQWTDQRHRYLLDSTLLAPWGDDQYDLEGIRVRRHQPTLLARCWMAPLLPFCFLLPRQAYGILSSWFACRFETWPGPIDVVHNIRIGREHFSWASLALARSRGSRFFITPNFSPRMQTRLGRVLMRNFFELLRQADGVFVFTPAEKLEIERLGVQPERIVTMGVGPLLAPTWNAAEFRARHGIRDRMVLFLGQKLPYKGFDLLVEAAPKVWATHPETSFVFIGPHYGNSREVLARIRDPRIVDLPRVDALDPLKASALAAADVFALPSRQEGIGGVYIEAWAMRKPVIACRIPFLTIEDGVDGFMVAPDSSSVADRILWLLNHPEEARAMGERGHAKVQRDYDWEKIVDRVEAAYQRLTPKPRTP